MKRPLLTPPPGDDEHNIDDITLPQPVDHNVSALETTNRDSPETYQSTQEVFVEISQPSGRASLPSPSADISAALINQAMTSSEIDQQAAKLSTRKLKRISEEHPRNYIGLKGNQRRLVAAPRHDLYDINRSPDRVVKSTRQPKAHTVDTGELQWPAHVTVPPSKKRKVTPPPQVSSAQEKSHETRSRTVKDRPPNVPKTRAAVATDDSQVRVAPEHDAAQRDRPSGAKRRRPRKAQVLTKSRDNEGRGIMTTESPQTVSSAPKAKRKPGKPRKAPAADSQQPVEAPEPTSPAQAAQQVQEDCVVEETGPNSTEATIVPDSEEGAAEKPPLIVEDANPKEASPMNDRTRPEAVQRKETEYQQPEENRSSDTANKPANTVQLQADSSHEDDTSDSEEEDFDLPHFPKQEIDLLRTAFKAATEVDEMRCDNEDFCSVKTEDAQSVLDSCRNTRDLITMCESRRLGNNEEQVQAPGMGDVKKVDEAINGVCQQIVDIMNQPEWDNRKLIRDMYAHVFPNLTLLFRKLLQFYAFEDTALSYEQLRNAGKVMKTITTAGYKIQRGNSKKAAFQFPIKRPLQTILASLKKALEGFEDQIENIKETYEAARRAERAGIARIREEQEEQTQQKEARERAWLLNWERLHSDRHAAELRGKRFLDPRKTRHLRVIPIKKAHERNYEVDANGEPIERMQMFGHRASQAPDHKPAEMQPWESDLLYELMKGLETYAGPRVYQKIFDQCCRDGQVLQPYNVSEIVEQAVWLRECLSEAQGDKVQQWVRDIPDPRVPPS